ncbi:MAG: hypothetical protein Q8L20_14325 [Gammaproteobacteria bacterium]|nr:hypothetical protein [Gammaproteobacteria bacterium]
MAPKVQTNEALPVPLGSMLRALRSANVLSVSRITLHHNNHMKFAHFVRRTPAALAPLMNGRYAQV